MAPSGRPAQFARFRVALHELVACATTTFGGASAASGAPPKEPQPDMQIGQDMKHCRKCDTTKPLDEFYNNRSASDGKGSYCKPCWSAYMREQTVKHRQRKNATTAKWYQRNRERKATQVRAWREVNSDRVRAVQAEYRRAHKGELVDKRAQWQNDNPHLVRAAALRAVAKRKGATVYTITLHDLIRVLTSPCSFPGCRRDDIELDHIIPLSRGGSHGIGNIQALCGHHNRTKHNKTWMEYRLHLLRKAQRAA